MYELNYCSIDLLEKSGGRRRSKIVAILMFEFWREGTATSVPGSASPVAVAPKTSLS